MRKSTNKIKIEKCKCGKIPELLCNNVGGWYVYCPNCRECGDASTDPITAIKSWNEDECKCELTVPT